MIDDACEEILQHERNGHKRDIWFAVIIGLVDCVDVGGKTIFSTRDDAEA